MSYTLRLLPRAEKELASLDPPIYKSVKQKILSLGDTPRPPGCRKLSEREGWRMRVGDMRIIYEIDDVAKNVTVLRVGHRREIYR